MSKETRTALTVVELRAGPEGRRIAGLAVRWHSLSADLGGFRERFEPGAFVNLDDADLRVIWQHDTRYVLGRSGAGTARFSEDSEGLRFEADVPAATWASDAAESIRRGDVYQTSFAFRVLEGGERWTKEGGVPVRVVTRAHLYEAGPQTVPAYSDTSVAVRTLRATLGQPKTDDERRAATARLVAEVGSPPASTGPSWTAAGKSVDEIRAEVRRLASDDRRGPVELPKPSRWGSEGRAVACHEAGHVLLLLCESRNVLSVGVTGRRSGFTATDSPLRPSALLAGSIAEALYRGCGVTDLPAHARGADMVAAHRALAGRGPDVERAAWAAAEREVRRGWGFIEALADLIVQTPGGIVPGPTVEALWRGHVGGK